MVMCHQPLAFSKYEYIGGDGLHGVEICPLKDNNVLDASYKCKFSHSTDRDIISGHLHLLVATKDSTPALTNLTPSPQHIPAWVDAADPVFVQPDSFHGVQRSRVECFIELLIGGLHFDFKRRLHFRGRLH